MFLEEQIGAFKKALATNANTSSFGSKIPTTTEPTNDGVVNLANTTFGAGGLIPRRMLIVPYGVGSDNDGFSLRILGWHRIGGGAPPNTLWVPVVLAELAVLVSAAVGIVGSPVLNTERFADTITVVTQGLMSGTVSAAAASFGDLLITSPTNDLIAHAILNLKGFEKVEFQFDQTTNTPTMNLLYKMF